MSEPPDPNDPGRMWRNIHESHYIWGHVGEVTMCDCGIEVTIVAEDQTLNIPASSRHQTVIT